MFDIIILEPLMFVETLFMKIDDFNFHLELNMFVIHSKGIMI